MGNFLYASNTVTRDVSAFLIEPETGNLTPIPGSPFPTGGGVPGDEFSLAATPDGQFLYAAQGFPATIRVFRIAPEDGRLTPVGALIPLPGPETDAMKVSPDGKWLALAVVDSFKVTHGAVAMFSIDSETGALAPVPGSPFPPREPGDPRGGVAGLDINCTSDRVFASEGTHGTTIVDVLSIDPDTGALSPIKGSPFLPDVGRNSNVPLLSPDDSLLFVSNQGSNSVTVFAVAADGSLTLVPGSPFDAGFGDSPDGMATDPAGAFLYVAKLNTPTVDTFVHVFSVGTNGELTGVEGSPFPVGLPGIVLSLAAYPGKTCAAQKPGTPR